ncbi:hypothetical protein B484DRAFT_420165, partial [Ochromonadaceae sp. CCMP2298]
MSSLLSPLVWGNWELSERGGSARTEQGARDPEARRRLKEAAKTRCDEPRFYPALRKASAGPWDCFERCYTPNPLACPDSRLSAYAAQAFDWESMPADADIRAEGGRGGGLPDVRVVRKRQQLANIMCLAMPFLQPPTSAPTTAPTSAPTTAPTSAPSPTLAPSPTAPTAPTSTPSPLSSPAPAPPVVVDFCCGCGHQSIPLALLFPQVQFVLLDAKQRSLDVARARVQRLGLRNVTFFLGFVEDFASPFTLGLALHACGAASDMVQAKCIAAQAAYVLIPCCVGKVNLSCITYPRSSTYCGISAVEYRSLAKAADFGHGKEEGGEG